MFQLFVFSFLVILSNAEQNLSKCERLNENLQNLCKNTGYYLIARYPTKNGSHYQDTLYKDIQREHKLFSNCSKLSQLIVCSRYVRKCSDNESMPILPCTQECKKFLQDCSIELAKSNLERFYSDLCRLKGNWSRVECIKPEGIRLESNSSGERKSLTCYCSMCGKDKNFCQTNGSCFIQSLLTKKGIITLQRTCLQPGHKNSFICQYSKDYPYAKCCQEDFCNKDVVRTITTTGAPSTRTAQYHVETIFTEDKAIISTSATRKETSAIIETATKPNKIKFPENTSTTRVSMNAKVLAILGIFIFLL